MRTTATSPNAGDQPKRRRRYSSTVTHVITTAPSFTLIRWRPAFTDADQDHVRGSNSLCCICPVLTDAALAHAVHVPRPIFRGLRRCWRRSEACPIEHRVGWRADPSRSREGAASKDAGARVASLQLRPVNPRRAHHGAAEYAGGGHPACSEPCRAALLHELGLSAPQRQTLAQLSAVVAGWAMGMGSSLTDSALVVRGADGRATRGPSA